MGKAPRAPTGEGIPASWPLWTPPEALAHTRPPTLTQAALGPTARVPRGHPVVAVGPALHVLRGRPTVAVGRALRVPRGHPMAAMGLLTCRGPTQHLAPQLDPIKYVRTCSRCSQDDRACQAPQQPARPTPHIHSQPGSHAALPESSCPPAWGPSAGSGSPQPPAARLSPRVATGPEAPRTDARWLLWGHRQKQQLGVSVGSPPGPRWDPLEPPRGAGGREGASPFSIS